MGAQPRGPLSRRWRFECASARLRRCSRWPAVAPLRCPGRAGWSPGTSGVSADETVRPEIPSGSEGRGGVGRLSLDKIREMST